jgi:antitoxin component YwqK of YwqJK toxin-antitoxin module
MAKNISYHHKEQIKLREEYYEIDGKKEGVYKSYYDNGQFTF